MLIGEHIHSIDDKNRVSLPSKFRQEMGKKVILARGLENCISVYTQSSWKKMSEKLSGKEVFRGSNRGFNRFIFGGASEAEVDSLGRILVPDFLLGWAKLSTKVVILGVESHVEIWNEKTWRAYSSSLAKQASVFADTLGAPEK